MKIISKHIDKYQKNKLSEIDFRKILLNKNNLNSDFDIPKRKLEKHLKSKEKLLNEKIINIIKDVTAIQGNYYSDLIKSFLNIKTDNELKVFLGLSNDLKLIDYLNSPEIKPYTIFYIPKTKGGFRKISKPSNGLKIIQKRISFLLNLLYLQHPAVHGFTWNRNIITNAGLHVNKKSILNIDIKNFFPSIKSHKIKELFSKAPFYFNKDICDYLTIICCHKDSLPQGAPTSPIITNIFCKDLDEDLSKYAESNNCIYSRYADDITFSSDSQDFDDSFITEIKNILLKYGFKMNPEKKRIQNKYDRQEVTGLIVNEKVNINRKYIRTLRAILHNLEYDSKDKFDKKYKIEYEKYHLNGVPYYLNFIKGKLKFIKSVRGEEDIVYLKLLHKFNNLLNLKNGY